MPFPEPAPMQWSNPRDWTCYSRPCSLRAGPQLWRLGLRNWPLLPSNMQWLSTPSQPLGYWRSMSTGETRTELFPANLTFMLHPVLISTSLAHLWESRVWELFKWKLRVLATHVDASGRQSGNGPKNVELIKSEIEWHVFISWVPPTCHRQWRESRFSPSFYSDGSSATASEAATGRR